MKANNEQIIYKELSIEDRRTDPVDPALYFRMLRDENGLMSI